MSGQSPQALGALSISPASGALGAIIEGVQIRNLDSLQLDLVRTLLDEYSVLVFRDQKLSPEEQIAFTAHFGVVEQHPSVISRQYSTLPSGGRSEKVISECQTSFRPFTHS